MLPTTLIAKKRDGQRLTTDEISFLIRGFTADEIKDYQMSALAMAICIQGFDAEETAALTIAMLESGDRLPKEADQPIRVDKHSTGGLGDKVSLILAPLLAAAGVHVPMISGRGLGITGGTLDKLESIPGFQIDFDSGETRRLLRTAGCFIIAANDQIAPADKRLYALRDVTATVESVGLITASILSKKLAASLDALVMDVKVGSAAFMKTEEQALQLAQSLVQTGNIAGLPVTALITDMDQPLGRTVGNAIEVNESLEVLQGAGPSEVRDLTIELAANVLHRTSENSDLKQRRMQLSELLDSGAAMETFERMVVAQSGKLTGPLRLAAANPIASPKTGYLKEIDCRTLGEAIVALGGGRKVKDDCISYDVGLHVNFRIGDHVQKGDEIAVLYAPTSKAELYKQSIQNAFRLVDDNVPARPLIHKILE